MSLDLDRPVREGARLRALQLLDAVVAERARLDGDEDPEAMHDFRVALRRLRSLLKAYAPRLGKKVARLRRRLGDVADLTTEARDAEVQLAWLDGQRGKLRAAARPALDWLKTRLEARKHHGYHAARTGAAPAIDALLPKARKRLARFTRDVASDGDEPTLGAALAGLLVEHADALEARLAAVAGPGDEATAHEARILGKQLRYLLEPLAEVDRVAGDAAAAVKLMKGLQDALGELHDGHVLGHVVQQAIVDASAERAGRVGAALFAGKRAEVARDLGPGLLALAGRVRDWRDRVHAGLTRPDLAGPIRALAAQLAGPRAPLEPAVEIERKYLLRALPKMPKVNGAEVLEIEQGYLPGDRIEERLRRLRAPGGKVQLVRTLKVGKGLTRVEVEEDCPPDLFARLWRLTVGRRIAKTRYRVPDGDRVWEIDRFRGRDLLLAEVELPSADTEVTLPDWLAEVVVRDVTDEKGFSNSALARAPAARPKARRRSR